ncbi:MAG: hemolysin III family protein [Planctomycetales bacterium]|nr:hemolysin III family protein [Planctomycetales bacterium]
MEKTLSQSVAITGPPGASSEGSEFANIVTHGVGVLLSLIAMAFFWFLSREQNLGLRFCCVAFTISMALVYLFSTLSHAVREPQARNRMRAWDQGTIYLLIAGTYSPFIWLGSPAGFRTGLLVAVWAAAAIGFYSKVLTSYRINSISTVTYVMLGWLPALPLLGRTPWVCFAGMLLGGICYTSGIFFLMRSHHHKYYHAIWHVLVMLGSATHSATIYWLLQTSTQALYQSS